MTASLIYQAVRDWKIYINNGDFDHAKRISSKSVKHLSVIDSSFNEQIRTIIDVPSTISLWLENPWDRTPVLGSMPLLAVAFVRFGTDCMSLDECYNSESGDCDDEHCQGCYGLEGDNFNGSAANVAKNNKSVLPNGLSGAKSLVLTDESQKVYLHFILKFILYYMSMTHFFSNIYIDCRTLMNLIYIDICVLDILPLGGFLNHYVHCKVCLIFFVCTFSSSFSNEM
jgi:hypothetical protein